MDSVLVAKILIKIHIGKQEFVAYLKHYQYIVHRNHVKL